MSTCYACHPNHSARLSPAANVEIPELDVNNMCNKTFEQKKFLNGLGMAGRRKCFDRIEKNQMRFMRYTQWNKNVELATKTL